MRLKTPTHQYHYVRLPVPFPVRWEGWPSSIQFNVTEDMVAKQVSCGPDPERHVEAITKYLDAGFDEVYINQIGSDQEGFFDFYRRELRPRLDA